MKSHRPASGMNCPYAGQESVGGASVAEDVTCPVFLASCFFGGKGKKQEAARAKLSLHPHTWAILPNSVAGCAFTCFPAGHTPPISPPRGPRLAQGLATHAVTAANATHHEGITTRYSAVGPPVTTHLLRVCTVLRPSPPLLSWMNHLPGSGERVHGPSDQVTRVTDAGRGWGRYCTWAQREGRRAALPRRGRAQRSFGANKGIGAHACLFSTLLCGGPRYCSRLEVWEEKEK